jgi:hypothetical protein
MAELSFVDVIAEMKNQGDLNRNSGSNSIKSLKQTNIQQIGVPIAQMRDALNDFVEAIESNTLKQIEKDREQRAMMEELIDSVKGSGDTVQVQNNTDNAAFVGGFGGFFSGLLGIAAGVVVGQLKAIKFFAGLGKDLAKMVSKAFKVAMGPIKGAITASLNVIKNAFGFGDDAADLTTKKAGFLSRMKAFFGFGEDAADVAKNKTGFIAKIKSFFSISDDFKASLSQAKTDFVAKIKSFFTINPDGPLGKAVSAVKEFIGKMAKPFSEAAETLKSLVTGGKEAGPITKIKNLIGVVKGYFTSMGAMVSRVAGIFGKIFAPIAIVMTAFDTIKGAVDGFEEGGILGGIKGAIDGLFTSLITKPLDLLKDGVAWVLKKLGFDEESEALSSFSFTELFTKMTKGVFDFIDKTIDWVVGIFTGETDVIGGISDMMSSASDFMKRILRSVLPDPTKDYGLTDPEYYALKAIPDAIYEWAGLNPATGELIAPAGGTLGADLNTEQLEANAAAGGAGGVVVVNNNNAINNNTSNSSASIQGAVPAARKPEDDDDNWAFW